MSDAIDRVIKRLGTLQIEREKQGVFRLSGEELLYGKAARYLKRPTIGPDQLEYDGRNLIAEFEAAYFSSGGLEMPADVREAIEHHIEASWLSSAKTPAQKDKGGAPPKFTWDIVIREVMRKVSIDGVPTPGAQRAELQRHIMDFCHQTWGDGAPGDSTVRQKLASWLPASV